jgi:tRNA(fMet)-specific endonuclease VapC
MSLRYLLDTNIISEPIRPTPNTNVLDRLIAAQSTMAIASIVWHETLLGCYRLPTSKRRQTIEDYLQNEVKTKLPILPRERARLIPIGLTPSYADGQIAAVAAVNQLILVTRNVSDYQNFDGLFIENWFDP